MQLSPVNSKPPEAKRVLIAEDDQRCRDMLFSSLKKWGYETTTAKDGLEAWNILQSEDPPPLAIIDWNMPGLDGLEICRRVKERKKPFVYLILLTGRCSSDDMVRGLEAGADNFISKPFNLREFQCHVAVGWRMVAYDRVLLEMVRKLEAYATQMEILAQERARQLVHTCRLASLGTLSAGIAHEINNPASFIASNLQNIEDLWPIIERALSSSPEADTSEVLLIKDEVPGMVKGMRYGIQRIAQIVSALNRFARGGRGERLSCRLEDCINAALTICRNALKYHVTTQLALEALPPILICAREIEQVLINLFTNAADAMMSKGSGTLNITLKKCQSGQQITVEDEGPGIPVTKLQQIWEPFFSTKEAGHGTGLGLSISREIIHDHGGTIRVENRPEGGARFIIELPIKEFGEAT